MANFGFSLTGPRRNPTADERANGFPCGAADQLLFNGLQYRLEAELANLITFAGIAPTDADFTQVRQAIQALIAAATGGGATSDYLLISQATARLAIFPEIQTTDGRITLSVPGGGVVRVPSGITIMHRGVMPYVTVQTDFNTVSSKTYHLRWSPTGGFVLKDLADVAYNPTTANESDPIFDSTYDNMLVARVVTNAGNVATLTSLANKDRLWLEYANIQTTGSNIEAGASSWTLAFRNVIIPINWARVPKIHPLNAVVTASVVPVPGVLGGANVTVINSTTRYAMNYDAVTDYGAAGVTSPRLDTKASFGA